MNQRVLITGAASGIGRALAEECTQAGFEVLATARDPSRLDTLDVAKRISLDVNDASAITRALSNLGPVDVLVNNAGIGIGGPTELVPVDQAQRMFETNLFGAMRMIQAVLPSMRRRGHGTIVNISSMTSRLPWPMGGLYAASKAALETVSEALWIELRPFGVNVMNVQPGVVNTGMNFTSFGGDKEPYNRLQEQWRKVFDRWHPGPEAVAKAVVRALQSDAMPLRLVIGEDAATLLSARAELSDEAFATTLLGKFGVKW